MDIPPNAQVSNILEEIIGAGTSYSKHELGAREKLLSLAYSLASAVELPSETIQRIGWAEVTWPEPFVEENAVNLMTM